MIFRALNVAGILVPVALVLLWPPLSTYEFSPRRVIHSSDTTVLLASFWICPASIHAFLSRLVQAAIISRAQNLVVAYAYALWLAIASVRTLTGYLLTRSVGWAFPALFSHSALYESASGFGPSLLALLVLNGVPELPSRLEPLFVGAICAALTWLEDAPWTYAIATLVVVPISLVQPFFLHPTTTTQFLLPISEKTQSRTTTRARHVAIRVLACLVVVVAPQWLPTPSAPAPTFPTFPNPLLDIVVLSYPRPHDDPTSSLLNTTLASLIPLAAVPGIAISVFTHANINSHPSFLAAQSHFAPKVEFYADTDVHVDAAAGQYLHAGEALRWAADTRKAEWVMLLEDDFPLCGEKARRDLALVMQELERGRHGGQEFLERRGAFIGTGGSGLIFHRTLLPIVSTTLHLHASTASALPVDVVRRPADLVMQDCLLGTDPLCPRRAEVMKMHHAGRVAPGGNMVITSRMIIDHIGAVSSTAANRRYGQDQWRCGWRHPFHGMDEVDVVVV
ncbi:hypothetical protein FB45DRAFT_360255 [Roridomyces roridus]|uniref:Uncharacterized protein n=1 Tax=Roridomyces roridus TaxID=1738132 RepID=A0AAD7FWT4_9AGAR|nr:hypothetical protein FB45DRAFT_360255 [Roridomyces roridus]